VFVFESTILTCLENIVMMRKLVFLPGVKKLEIDRYGFFEADTDISAIHGPMHRPIPIFPKFLNLVFCFIIKNIMYFMPYLFYKNLKIRIYKLEFLKL